MLDLVRCRSCWQPVGALHPGCDFRPLPVRQSGTDRRRRRPRARVLFLCTGNSARSQIAEALVEQLADGAVQAFSAGSHPKPMHPNTVQVMRARGIDLASRRSRPISKFADRQFGYVVSLCDRVREVCPELPHHPQMIHWSIPDPAREGDTDEETLPAFERTADELAARIPFLLELIEHNLFSQEVT
jgi:ArsR family transcriptional regulator, arsenate/arsenite/antimonite-responsive transcriptional repressor / arsenate reductase (thioredoxin)